MWLFRSATIDEKESLKKSSADKVNQLRNIPLDDRQKMTQKILDKYKNRVPVIISRSPKQNDLQDISKIKYLFARDNNFATLHSVIRQRIDLNTGTAIFLFVENDIIPPSTEPIGNVYEQNKNKDGFLYVIYNREHTFG